MTRETYFAERNQHGSLGAWELATVVSTKAQRNSSPVDEIFCYIREERRQVVNKIRVHDGVEISTSFVAHNDFLAVVQR